MSERTISFTGAGVHCDSRFYYNNNSHHQRQPQVFQPQISGLPSSTNYFRQQQQQRQHQKPIFVPRKVQQQQQQQQHYSTFQPFQVHTSFPPVTHLHHPLPANNISSDIRSRHFYPQDCHSSSKSPSFVATRESNLLTERQHQQQGYLDKSFQTLTSSSLSVNQGNPLRSSTHVFVHPSPNRIPVSVEIHTPFSLRSSSSRNVRRVKSRKKLRSSLPSDVTPTSSSTSTASSPSKTEAMTVFTILGDHTSTHSNTNSLKYPLSSGHSGSDQVLHNTSQQQATCHSAHQFKFSNGSLPSLPVNGFAVGAKDSPSTQTNSNLETIVEEISPSSLSKSSVRIDMNPSSHAFTSKDEQGNHSGAPAFSFVPPSPSGSFSSPFGVTSVSKGLGNSISEGGNITRITKIPGKNLLAPVHPEALDEIQSVTTIDSRLQSNSNPGRLEIEGGINPSKTRRKSSILSMDRLFRHKIGSFSEQGSPSGHTRTSIVSRLSFSSHPDDNELRVTNFNRLTDLRKILNPEEEKEDFWAAFWARFNSCDWFEWNLNNAAKMITIGVFVVTLILIVKAIINSSI